MKEDRIRRYIKEIRKLSKEHNIEAGQAEKNGDVIGRAYDAACSRTLDRVAESLTEIIDEE